MTDRAETLPLIIVGAGRQGRNIRDVCEVLGIAVEGFLDDTQPAGARVNGALVLGGFGRLDDPALLAKSGWIVGLGDNRIRRDLSRKIRAGGGALRSIVHPNCEISPWSEIGLGVYIANFTRVLPNSRVGDYAMIEALTSVGADIEVGEAAFIGPGCILTGGARIGPGAFVGAGSVVLDKGVVGANSVIGAGSTVIDPIPDNCLAVGTPARVKKRLD